MNLHLLVATSDVELSKLVGTKKLGYLDRKLLRNAGDRGVGVSASSILCNSVSDRSVLDYLTGRDFDHDGVVILIDSRLQGAASELSPLVLSTQVLLPDEHPNYANALRRSYALATRMFLGVFDKFNNEQYAKILMIPKDNFDAPEARDFFLRMSDTITSLDFLTHLDGFVRKMRERQTPKTASNYRDTYLKDDKEHFFALGKERHSRAESSVPPHSPKCNLSAKYRLGFKLDPERHYNASVENGNISGDFVDCHGAQVRIKPRSHINIFPNDFLK